MNAMQRLRVVPRAEQIEARNKLPARIPCARHGAVSRIKPRAPAARIGIASRAVRALATVFAGLALSAAAAAAPSGYTLDPEHTYPSFEADHMGVSFWRGKFNRTAGSVTLDREAGTGIVEVTVDLASIDFGHDRLNRWATGEQFFEVAKYPEAAFKGTLEDFTEGAPTRAVGTLTLNGATRPLVLRIDRFKCIPDPMLGRPRCGADARATFERDTFGLDAGKEYGFDMTVELRVQIEALENL